MARKRPMTEYIDEKPEYRAYFDPLTEQVIGVSSTPQEEYKHYAIITKDEFLDVSNYKIKFSDLIVDRFVTPSGKVEARILTKQLRDEFIFTSKSLTWIGNIPTNKTEFIVTHNKDSWSFHVTPQGRKILSGSLYDSTLVFFATLETDFDFLVRTFYIRIHDVLKADVLTYPFNSKIEKEIQHISITTKKFFNNYGLIIND